MASGGATNSLRGCRNETFVVFHNDSLTGYNFPSMYGKTKERWLELCEQAANEQDAANLKALIEDIARLLKEKEDRLKSKPSEK